VTILNLKQIKARIYALLKTNYEVTKSCESLQFSVVRREFILNCHTCTVVPLINEYIQPLAKTRYSFLWNSFDPGHRVAS